MAVRAECAEVAECVGSACCGLDDVIGVECAIPGGAVMAAVPAGVPVASEACPL